MLEIGYNILYYLIEGISICLSVWLLVTRFFGYPLKKQASFYKVSAAVLFGYVVLGASLNVFSSPGERKAVNGFLILFLVIYMMALIEEKRIKAFFICICACDMFTVFISIVYALDAVAQDLLQAERTGKTAGTREGQYDISAIICNMILLLIFWGLSALSDRRRKRPMAFSLVVAVFLTMILTDNLTMALLPEKYADFRPLFSLRILYEGEQSDAMRLLVLLCVSGILLVLCLIFFIKESEAIYFREKNTISEHYLEVSREHYERVIDSDREMRRIRHDIKNHAYCLRELYEKKKYEELGAYISAMTERVEQADTGVHTGNEIADAIISEKKRKAEEEGIPFFVEGSLSGLSLSALDTCTILANIIDNAIEASGKLPEVSREIRLSFRKNEHFFIILCENHTADEIEIVSGSISTTKKDKAGHGYGIVNVRETAMKNGGEYLIRFTGDQKAEYAGVFTGEVLIPV